MGDSHQWSRYVHLYLCIEHTHHTRDIYRRYVYEVDMPPLGSHASVSDSDQSRFIFNLFFLSFFFFFFFKLLLLLFILFLSDRHTQDWLVLSMTVYIVVYGRIWNRDGSLSNHCVGNPHTHTHENKYGEIKGGRGIK